MSSTKRIRAGYESLDTVWDAAGVRLVTADAFARENGISRQRVSQLAQTGRLGRVYYFGPILLIPAEEKKPPKGTIPPHVRRRMKAEAVARGAQA